MYVLMHIHVRTSLCTFMYAHPSLHNIFDLVITYFYIIFYVYMHVMFTCVCVCTRVYAYLRLKFCGSYLLVFKSHICMHFYDVITCCIMHACILSNVVSCMHVCTLTSNTAFQNRANLSRSTQHEQVE